MAKGKKKENLTPEERLQAALVPDSERPYKVPENWCWAYWGACGNFQAGVSYKKQDAHAERQEQDCLILRGGNVLEGAIETETGDNVYVSRNLVQEDQLLQPYDVIIVSSTGSSKVIGRAGISYTGYDNVAFGAFLTLVRPNDGIVKPFIAYYFQSDIYRNRIRELAAGVNINNIKANYITESPIPLPPFSEQQRIVDRIESLFAKLDEAKQKAQDTLDSFETRKAAILHKAFTGELTAQWRKEHGMGMESWEALTLDDIAEYKKGPFGSSITKAMFVPKGDHTYKVYEQGNAIRKTVDYGHYYISEQKYLELKNFAVRSNDIIISCAGTIGEVFKLPKDCEPGIINQALMRVRIFPNIKEQYFIYYLV